MEKVKENFSSDAEGEEIPREIILEGKKRVAIFVKVENLLDRLEAISDPEEQENIAEEIENILETNEKVIVRNDNSGARDMKEFRLRLDGLRSKRAAA